jgi:hypothetical protein
MSAGPLLFTAVLLLCSSASAAALPAAHTTAAGDSAPCRPRMRLFLFGPEGCLQLGDSLRLPDSLWLESLERLRKQLSELPQLLEQQEWKQESTSGGDAWLQEHRRFLEEELPRHRRQQELREHQRQLERERRALERQLRELERELERLRRRLEYLRRAPLEL